MASYELGDEVIVRDSSGRDSQWSFYLSGSTGIVDKVNDNGTYIIDFIDVCDAKPEVRRRHGHDLEFLVRNAIIGKDDLVPADHPLTHCDDDGFELVFE